jgi:small subunit ribosomal protein S4
MARPSEPVCRLCRREGQKLFLKGFRCYGPKCAVQKRPFPPGQFGESYRRRRRPSDFGGQLREKQKMRSYYGVAEKAFRKYVEAASHSTGIAGEVLLQLLERRLDNVVFRAGFASSRPEARQVVGHGHIVVNGRAVDIPSYRLRAGDVVSVRERSKGIKPVTQALGARGGAGLGWLQVDAEARAATVVALPTRDQIDVDVQEQQVMEFYSR